ncbi:antibiotic biosynthesis monooxygenase family protein [Thermomonospora umbrina]|uniref:Heme-degrading monooxygenase HmoA n=1 Tax=Thermomonospora umbrina TaxID=111806 RepID=A0A3D9SSX5_9ACTN|nr:antibiotic biosynthesis monooxygenase family protein [Thermomonospora umbrina]REE97580.1 heme-degrading monooxygenase HmoA [Thermomonospora umbrina]
MTVFVVLSARVKATDAEAFERAFARVRQAVRTVPGHRSDVLLRSPTEPGRYLLLGVWESTEKFLAWERSAAHRALTEPMRPFWEGSVEWHVFELAIGSPWGPNSSG